MVTLVDLARHRADSFTDRTAYTYLTDGESESCEVTYGELDRQSRVIAAWLQSLGAQGERAILLYPPGLDYIAAFFGCLYAKVVAVPAYPPQRKRTLGRLRAILADSGATFALTTTKIRAGIERLSCQDSGIDELRKVQWIETDALPQDIESAWKQPVLTAHTLAFLQYTSGSTGSPKGVMVSHENLLHNQRMIQQAFGHTGETTVLGWLPLYHDMGLIGNVLEPRYLGRPCVLMSPVHFMQKPLRWLSAISRYRATTSGAPNFAYDLCVRRISAEERDELDLSSWSVAFNGAEPIHAGTLDRFSEKFGPCGFRREAFYPCYGLAEATLFVTGAEAGAAPVLKTVEKAAMERGEMIDGSQAGTSTQRLVGCGRTGADQQVIIVDPETSSRRPHGQVGEIWVKGASVGQGYWNRPEATAVTFSATTADTAEGPFLRTGDLGVIQDGELFVVGRLKDLIIIRGRNHYPHDIEITVQESHQSLKSGGGAAFSIPINDEEQLIVVQEVVGASTVDLDSVASGISRAVTEYHEIQVHAVVLIKPGTLPKTSSGKVQRHLCRARFLGQELESIRTMFQERGTEERTKDETADFDDDMLETVTKIWVQVLDRVHIEPHDNFFELGGDSLRGIQVLAKVQAAYAVDLPLESLFDAPTVAGLAALIKREYRSVPAVSRRPQEPVTKQDVLPLSFSQERFWFLDQLYPRSSFNNIPVGLRIKGVLDCGSLHRALAEILRRHEILRARFVIHHGQPGQVIAPHLELPLPTEDLMGMSEPMQEERVRLLTSKESRHPFNLEAGHLMRVRLIRLSRAEQVLLLTIHHIIADGWSMRLLARELAQLYGAFKNGLESPLPILSKQYIDIVLHQRECVDSQKWKEQETYWRRQLESVPHVLALPFDFPRPAVQGQRGERCAWTVDAEVGRRLHAIGRKRQASLFMTVLASFNILLARYSGQSEFCVGTPVANRSQPERESIIGCFVNTLALRVDLSGNPSFLELLTQVRKTVLQAQANQDFPFERLVEALHVPRSLSHTPLHQVMLSLEEDQPELCSLDGLDVHRMKTSTQTSAFDLTLELVAMRDGSLEAVFEYSTDLFAGETIARMAGHFQELVRQIVLNPEARLNDLGMMSQEESRHVLEECNTTAAFYPPDSCLHHLFEEQARLFPDAVALVWNGASYSYRCLNERANQVAGYLRLQGVVTESPVAICMERSLEMVVALVGVLKAGAAYVPMDPLYPRERLGFMIEDSGAHLVLTQQQFVEKFQNWTVPIIALDEVWPAVAALPDIDGPSRIVPENLAYILYTSGTTGEPKGIAISHRALVNHSTAMARHYGLQPTDRVLQFASLSFDVAAEECFPTWAAGATVILRPNEPVPAFSDFRQFIEDHGLTVLNLPTPYWAEWLDALEQTDTALPHSIRLVIVGSEKARPESLVRWQRLAGDRIAWCNSYGPTEATITASYFMPERQKGWMSASTVPIGRPIANVQLYVLTPSLQPAPIGVPGELYIGGAGLARGYHRQPARTAEQFVPHWFSREPGARLYRTGDKVRRLADGKLEFLGRYDDQIKVRGFRVEPAEIEFWVKHHPVVKDALVLQGLSDQVGASVGGRPGEAQLIGYVVPKPKAVVTAQELRSFLAERLPRYMIPPAWVFLEAFPVTSRGKVDRHALRNVAGRMQNAEPRSAPPETDTERAIAEIWQAVLGLQAVGRHDNFFELGGDSIVSLQVIARAKQVGLLLSPRQIFQQQTVAELAAIAGREAAVALEAEQGAVTGEAGLTPIQCAFFELPLANPHHWNQSVLLEAKEPLVEWALEIAVAALIAHHDALRLRFSKADDGWRQSYAPIPQGPLVRRVNLAALSDSERRASFEAQATQWQGSLNISEGPLLNVVWFEMGDGS
ncbi:MAG: non-ribosomal peptide synthetase, partial [Nitrospira sp. LK265]|nr:non-ribosomal peptide synthetase [Nitrospira sp. LK265]